MNSETEYWQQRAKLAEAYNAARTKYARGEMQYDEFMLKHDAWQTLVANPPKEESQWLSVNDDHPPHLKTVWLCNREKGYVWLGCRVVGEDGYHWAASNGIIYSEKGEIVAECESDDLDVTHFCYLPTLPKLVN